MSSLDSVIRIWDLDKDRDLEAKIQAHPLSVQKIAFGSDDQSLTGVGEGGVATHFDLSQK